MITVLQSISGSYFSSGIPDVEFSITGYRAGVVISVDGAQIYSEHLYPVNGKIALTELDTLLTPYARQSLKVALCIVISEEAEDSSTATSTATLNADIIYCAADIGTSAANFVSSHFLTTLDGEKTTAVNRLEYLHYIGTDTATATAHYADGSTKAFKLLPVAGNSKYTTLDVSPGQFVVDGHVLVCFVIQAGERTFRFSIDFDEPDCACSWFSTTVLELRNSSTVPVLTR